MQYGTRRYDPACMKTFLLLFPLFIPFFNITKFPFFNFFPIHFKYLKNLLHSNYYFFFFFEVGNKSVAYSKEINLI